MGNPRVVRPEAPPILQTNAKLWTDELLQEQERWAKAGGRGRKPRAKSSRYSHREVRQAVGAMYHHLCCYCESRVAVTSYLRVEHYRPKGVDQYMRLAYAWENLHAACEMCNGAKREHFDETTPPVIPTDHDPLDHIRYEAGLPVGITPSGRWTLTYCGMEHRSDLFVAQAGYRQVYLDGMKLVKATIAKVKAAGTVPAAKETVVVEAALEDLEKACQPSSAWSTMVRSHVESQLQLLRSEWAQQSQPATG